MRGDHGGETVLSCMRARRRCAAVKTQGRENDILLEIWRPLCFTDGPQRNTERVR